MLRLCYKSCVILFLLVSVKGDEKKCGKPEEDPENRIVGGKEVPFFKYPWYAALVLSSNPRQLVCGGTLIDKKHVLTAAHCFKPFFKQVEDGEITLEDIYLVKLGVYNICVKEAIQKSYVSEKVYVHEKYYSDLLYYDIALIEMDSDTDFTPACLPQPGYKSQHHEAMKEGTIMGLGKESSNAWRLPCIIKEAQVKFQSDESCRKMLDNNEQDGTRLMGAFCAGGGEPDTCQGDSGGGIFVNTKGEYYTVVGITSFGFSCAKPSAYGVYTNCSDYMDWIKNCTESEDSSQKKIQTEEETDPVTFRPLRKRDRNVLRDIIRDILSW